MYIYIAVSYENAALLTKKSSQITYLSQFFIEIGGEGLGRLVGRGIVHLRIPGKKHGTYELLQLWRPKEQNMQ